MKAFLRFVLAHTVPVNLLFLLLIVVGIIALYNLPVERYPNVNMGKVVITTIFPGASPEDVEVLVTREIEEALDDLEHLEFIQSTSYRERSSITVKFIDDSDYDALFDELRLKVLSVMNELPDSIDPPIFTVVNVDDWLPAIAVDLYGDRSNRALTLMAEEMKIALRQIRGVKEVQLDGEFTREFHVFLDPGQLDKYGMTFDDVVTALNQANVSFPAGSYTNEHGEFLVVVDEHYRSRQEIADTIIRRDGDGSYVTVAQVMSDARIAYRDPYVITSANGKDCVTLKVIKTREGSNLDIVAEVEKIVEHFRPALAKEGVQVALSQDQRIVIYDSLRTLGLNLLCGIVLLMLLIWIFMGLRNALLTTVGIPFSFLVTMIIMYVTDSSLNEITLFAFVLISGIIVDDAIVVVENIYRHLQEGESLVDAVTNGTSEVTFPVISATSTTIAAFLPMFIMTGSTGEFFAQIPMAVSFAIIASLLECLIILPPHFVDWPGKHYAAADALRHPAAKERKVMAIIRSFTNRVVGLALRFRYTSLMAVLLAFVATMLILGLSISGKASLIRIKFFPDEYTLYYVELEGPLGTPIEATSEKLKEITGVILQGGPGQVQSAKGIAGFYLNEDYQPIFGPNLGHVAVELPPRERQEFPANAGKDPILYLDDVRGKLSCFRSGGWTVQVRPEKGGPPIGKDINIRVVGTNPHSVERLAENVKNYLKQENGIAPSLIDLTDDRGQPNRVYRYHVQPQRAAEFDLSVSQVAALAASVLDGRYVGKFRTADEDVDMKVRIDQAYLKQPESSLNLPLLQHPSGPVRLGELTIIDSYLEPGQLHRFQNNRTVTIKANLRPGAPTSVPSVVEMVRSYYQTIKHQYPGAELNFSGEFETTRRSYTSLTYAFLIALLIIYLILATQFRSYLQPLIILSAVVFALIGVVFGKLVTQGLFTVNSFVATVGVTGVVVNDSLVLIDFINRAYRRGLSRREAVEEGIRVRLRPILLTTLTTTLGLLPMALGIPDYSIVWGTMASTFVTGLCTATFLSVFIVPLEWELLMGLNLKVAGWRENRETA
ncbi:MAG: efflux RND transporter permease subunit [Desulforhabdus sp.]|jgi:HAE1 family hydrophobic/amphiphilic exporter-1|nr:efflux RND transporter permease subunit [Desulforhabdus sp.]